MDIEIKGTKGRCCCKENLEGGEMPKYIAAFLTMVLLLGGTAQVASAESDISQGQVQEILKEYNDSLQSAYFASNSRSSQNVPVTESTRQAEGLRTENVNISSEEISARHIDDGYEIQADVKSIQP